MNKERIETLLSQVKNEASITNIYADRIIEDIVYDIDNLMDNLNTIIDESKDRSIEDIPDCEIEYYIVRIPSLMYYIGSKMEEIAMLSELSSAKRREILNSSIANSTGSMVERKVLAEINAEDAYIAEAIYKRAHAKLKTRLDMADKVYSALKKALSKRIAECDLNRRDTYSARVG